MHMAKARLMVGIIFGGRSGEHAVSLMSARSVAQAIDRNKYDVTMIGISKAGHWIGGDDPLRELEQGGYDAPGRALLGAPRQSELMSVSAALVPGELRLAPVTELDVVFPLVHGTYGEDGALQGLMEMADVAYVGAGVVGSALSMDKGIFKSVMSAAGLPVLPHLVITRAQFAEQPDEVVAQCEAALHYPLFVKPANLGSSVGISRADDAAGLHGALVEAARWDRRLVVEQGIDAREIEVSVLGNDMPQASSVGEIRPRRGFYDYIAKYVSGDSELLIPAPLSPELTERAQSLAVEAFKAVDCAGMARVDFLLDKSTDQLWLNELNTIPGFTEISMYPKLWAAAGVGYPELIDRLIELALERKADRDRTERTFEV